MPFTPPLNKQILDCSKLILLPQLSTKETLMKAKPNYFRTAPKLFDCFSPLIGREGELLLSPFLGYVGICTVLEQILKQSTNMPTVFFYGTCGAIDISGLTLGSIVSPNSFYIEEPLDTISLVNQGSSSQNILSTSFILDESMEKFARLYKKHKISLVDMETAYIARQCLKYSVEFTATLLISDMWTQGDHSPVPHKISSLINYQDFISGIIN